MSTTNPFSLQKPRRLHMIEQTTTLNNMAQTGVATIAIPQNKNKYKNSA